MHTRSTHNLISKRSARRGAAYVVALLITTLLAAMVLVFAKEMRVEADASVNRVSQAQAQWIAQGVIEAVRGDLAYTISLGEAPRLEQVIATGQQMGGGMFWLIRPSTTDDDKISFGLESECGKLNLDAFSGIDAYEIEGMEPNLAAAIIDWQDRDERINPGGAESAYYLTRPTPYYIKNRDLETVAELAYVRDVTKELLYGEDTNRNGRLDKNEDDGDKNDPNDNANGELDRGFVDHFTVYSRDPAVSDDGRQKLTLDTKQAESERRALENFMVSKLGEERGKEVAAKSFNFTSTAGQNKEYISVLHFFTVTGTTDEEFELVHDRLRRKDQNDNLEGIIDVYYASETVLSTLPGLDRGDARAIIAARPKLEPGEAPRNISWIIDVLGEEKAIAAARYMTHRSYQFTADIVALSGDGRGFCRLRVVLDCRRVLEGEETLPRIRHIEDLTALGWPLDEETRKLMRDGASPQDIAMIYNEDFN